MKNVINDGLFNVIKGFIILICLISLMDSINKDVQAVQVNKSKADLEYEAMKERARLRYLKVVEKYKDK